MQGFNEWLAKVEESERVDLLAIKDNDDQIKRQFDMPLDFGTAGMRGIIALGTACINNYTVRRATLGVANYIIGLGEEAMARGVVVSYDTRNFSYEFALETAKVLAFNKIKVHLYNDVHPVPMCSFAIRHLGAVAGVMITASHNPKQYNGYKVYGDDGAQMAIDATNVVVGYINSVEDYFSVKTIDLQVDRSTILAMNEENLCEYIDVIGASTDACYYAELEKLSLSPEAVARVASKMKIVYTPIHGSGYKPVTEILGRMGIPCSVVEEQKSPDGNFPTVAMPNPEQPDTLLLGITLAKKVKSDIVIGTDPDADRMGIALRNNKGEFILLTGNQIGAMLLNYILLRHTELGTLPANSAVVKTIVTTMLADKIAMKYGATVYNVLTGFKFIGEKIKEWETNGEHTFMFGYEESFGYLSGTHARDKDAVVSSMLFAEMACYYDDKGVKLCDVLDSIYAEYGYFVEVSKSIAFGGLDGMNQMSAVMDKLRAHPINNLAGIPVVEFLDYRESMSMLSSGEVRSIDLPKTNVVKYQLSDDEWACVRPSGTEPKLKIYVSVKGKTNSDAIAKNNNVLGFVEQLVLS